MSLGYSLSDIALGVKLVASIISTLRQSGGASMEYQELHRDLSDLHHVLNFLQRAKRVPRFGSPSILNAIAARAEASTIRLDAFLKSLRKYECTLNHSSKWNIGIPRKIQWPWWRAGESRNCTDISVSRWV